ncbi:hypothetical protein WJX72_002170 [[Myrmecia] bisecta]|uniref:Uncharacterized protein n=1 Tax=[Myrmecia] bisecta TaxID=41462 RepID=A0AAW1R5A6_9CHLO
MEGEGSTSLQEVITVGNPVHQAAHLQHRHAPAAEGHHETEYEELPDEHSESLHTLVLAGVAGLVGGALSMACGEYISVSSQRDAEEADVEKERKEQAKGPQARLHELEELAQIYENRGLSPGLARQVAVELTEKDVIKAHARDELGIDLDDMSNPAQAAIGSALSFTVGAGIPLLASAFIQDYRYRLISLVLASTAALAFFGSLGAVLGGASTLKGGARVVVGGWLAMGITYGIGRAFPSGYATH